MKKGIVVSICFAVLVLLCAVPTQAWQGRMAGMGGVYGLVEDESDFLTHPASIANGKGLNFYGNMRFGLQTTDKLEYSVSGYEFGDPADWWVHDSEASGREFQYEGLFGGAFPVGKGRMGIFLQYTGFGGSLRGDTTENDEGDIDIYPFDIKNKLDALSLRVLYGIPVTSNLKLGAEFGLGYKKEKVKTKISDPGYATYTNAMWGYDDGILSLLPLAIPYESRYYEASMKASLETTMGPAKASFTVRGSIPFSSKNEYFYEKRNYTGYYGGDNDGKVKGYNAGADAWVRLPINSSLTLPFLATVDFKDLKRDTDGLGFGNYSNRLYDQESREKTLSITAGGGVDYIPVKDMKIAAGLYYTYLYSRLGYYFNHFNTTGFGYYNAHNGYPKTTGHRVSLKAAVEKAFSSDMAFNAGFNAFYGPVKEKYQCNFHRSDTNTFNSFGSLKGKHWGAGASAGLSFKAGATIMEPYVIGSFERLSLSGDGMYYSDGVLDEIATDIDLKKKNWFFGAGLSMRF